MPHPKRKTPKRKPQARFSAARTSTVHPPLTSKDLEGFEFKIRDAWGWKDTPRLGQVEAIKAQLKGLDVEVHAYTGWGKTCVAAGPHVHPSAKGRVSIMVSPLIALQNEMVTTFEKEYNLKAIAVNSSHGGCTPEVLQNIVDAKYQIVLISPELLLSRKFITQVLRNESFTRRLLSVVVDEAHVVSHWGSQFRKKYGQLGMIRSFMPEGASMVAMSATLPAKVREDVRSKLQFHKTNYVSVDVGNNRENVAIIVRAIQHPLNTYVDLDFVIPSNTATPNDIPLTWIYADNKEAGTEIESHLEALLPDHLKGHGIIRPYNATLSNEYRTEAMRQVREGHIRVLVCTDAAGMGCNIPNIEVVVQWKLPGSMSSFVQRAGRAARGPGMRGRAVLLVEKSVYSEDLTAPHSEEPQVQKGRRKGKKKKKAGDTKKAAADRAKARGVNRGSRDGKHDVVLVQDQPSLDPNDPEEGLKVLAQTGLCRRRVWKEVFANKDTDYRFECCDICHPALLNLVRPGEYTPPVNRKGVKKGIPSEIAQEKLHEWRTAVRKRDFPGSLFASSAILSNELLLLLASVGPIQTRDVLEQVLAGQWLWLEKYGDELLNCLQPLNIQFVPLPAKPKGTKRAAPPPETIRETVRRRTERSTETLLAENTVLLSGSALVCTTNQMMMVEGQEASMVSSSSMTSRTTLSETGTHLMPHGEASSTSNSGPRPSTTACTMVYPTYATPARNTSFVGVQAYGAPDYHHTSYRDRLRTPQTHTISHALPTPPYTPNPQNQSTLPSAYRSLLTPSAVHSSNTPHRP